MGEGGKYCEADETSLVAQTGKQCTCNARDPGLIPGLGRSPGEGNGKPTPVFLSGKSLWTEELGGLLGSQRVEQD